MLLDERCVGCGLCAEVCPVRCIEIRDGKSALVEARSGQCIGCGHCEAYCPSNALAVGPETSPDDLAAVRFDCNPASLAGFMKSRRTVRGFEPKPVDRQTVARVLDAVRYSPTGGNRQAVQWTIFMDEPTVKALVAESVNWLRAMATSPAPALPAELVRQMIDRYDSGAADPILCGAPHLAVVHAPSAAMTGRVDSIIAASWFDLLASAEGLGTVWGGFFHWAVQTWPPLLERLELPEGNEAHFAIAFGLPRHRPAWIPSRKDANVRWVV